MNKHYIRALALACIALLIGCVSQSRPKIRAFSTSGTWSGSVIDVYFLGLIAHNATNSSTKPWRALLIDATNTKPKHRAMMTLPGVNEDELEIALGYRVPCASGCTISIDGLGVQFVDSQGGRLQPGFSTSSDFTTVPHLQDASTSAAFNLTKDALSNFPPVPPIGSKRRIASYVELNGGTLSVADPYGCPAHYSHENDSDSRVWPDTLRLSGTTSTPVALQIKRPGGTLQWKTVSFASPSNYVSVIISNLTAPLTGMSHFRLFAILANPDVTLDDVVTKSGCRHPVDSVPGCSNSQWP